MSVLGSGLYAFVDGFDYSFLKANLDKVLQACIPIHMVTD